MRFSLRLLAGAIVAAALAPAARSGETYDLSWHTIDSGGGDSAGGGFNLTGTIGQPDAGEMSGGGVVLTGGFWAGTGDPGMPPECLGDLDGSNAVNAADLAQLLGAWSIPTGTPGCNGASPCPADLNGDTLVNAADLALLLGAWGSCS